MARIGAQRVPPVVLLICCLDAFSLALALCLAVILRLHDQHAIISFLGEPHIALRFLMVVLVCQTALYYCDLYNPAALTSGLNVFMGLLKALGSTCLLLAVIYYLDDDVSLGRGIAALSGPIAFALMLLARAVLRRRSPVYGPERVMVVGTAPAGISAVREILSRPELNLEVKGFLSEGGKNIGKSLINPRIIGAVEDVESIAIDGRIDRLIISLAERRGQMPVSQLLHLKFAGVGIEDSHSFIESVTGRIHLEQLSPSWLILSDGFRKSRLLYSVKRLCDLLVALFSLVITFPIMILVALGIWFEDGGPILFRQERTGLHGRPFRIVKFRSMRADAESGGPIWASPDDNRITRVGRFIRKFRLDELPQILNVLRGDMSFVGPRPERPYFCNLLKKDVPLFDLRHSVRPGITGWAQIKYQYGGSVEESKTKLEYDFFYIKHMSLFLDSVILLETAKVMLYGRGAK
jgi:sugar transferase (PEP-CTERM system associated)